MDMNRAAAGPQPDSAVPVGERIHPVQQIEKSRYVDGQKYKFAEMQEQYGIALPMRHQFTERLLSQQRRLAPLESSYLHLDVYRGEHTEIAWEDYLADPQHDEAQRRPTHNLMEEQLFGRVLQPLHTKDVL